MTAHEKINAATTLVWLLLLASGASVFHLVASGQACSDFHNSRTRCSAATTDLSCQYCSASGRCVNATQLFLLQGKKMADVCPGYVDLCSVWNGDSSSCAGYALTKQPPRSWTLQPRICMTTAKCTFCRYCKDTQVCMERDALNSTEACPSYNRSSWATPDPDWCSNFDENNLACNVASPTPATCLDNQTGTTCGPCFYCPTSQKCLSRGSVSAQTCCGWAAFPADACAEWVDSQGPCGMYNSTIDGRWVPCETQICQCTQQKGLCQRLQDPCHTARSEWECNGKLIDRDTKSFSSGPCPVDHTCVACSYCQNSSKCFSSSLIASKCPGWVDTCSSYTSQPQSSCRASNPSCKYCPALNQCVLNQSSACSTQCSVFNNQPDSCFQFECDVCVATGECVDRGAKCPRKCRDWREQPSTCTLLGCFVCWQQGNTCATSAEECDPCDAVSFRGPSTCVAFNSSCTYQASCFRCAYCPANQLCMSTPLMTTFTCPGYASSPCNSYSSSNHSTLCESLDDCVYCNTTQDCVNATSARVFDGTCSACKRFHTNQYLCNTYTVKGSLCMYCNSTQQCMDARVIGAPAIGGYCSAWNGNCSAWDNDRENCDKTAFCVMCPSTRQCLTNESEASIKCPYWSTCASKRRNEDGDLCYYSFSGSCSYCSATKFCMLSSSITRAICPSWYATNCSKKDPLSYAFCSGVLDDGTPCQYCHPSKICVPYYNLSFMKAVCPTWADGNCSTNDKARSECIKDPLCEYCSNTSMCRYVNTTDSRVCPGWTSNCSKYDYSSTSCAMYSECRYCTGNNLCLSSSDYSSLCPPTDCRSIIGLTPCAVAGCQWCTSASAKVCLAPTDRCNVCLSQNSDPTRCNTQVYDPLTFSFQPTCGSMPCTRCSYCQSAKQCSLTNISCPDWSVAGSQECGKWTGNFASNCNLYPSVNCSWCPTNKVCFQTNSTSVPTVCPNVSCSSFDGDATGCRHFRLCFYCNESNSCVNDAQHCDLCRQFNTLTACHLHSLDMNFHVVLPITQCVATNNCTRCAFCPSTNLCFATALADPQVCPNWRGWCDVWNTSSSSSCNADPLCFACPQSNGFACTHVRNISLCNASCSYWNFDNETCNKLTPRCLHCSASGTCLKASLPCSACVKYDSVEGCNFASEGCGWCNDGGLSACMPVGGITCASFSYPCSIWNNFPLRCNFALFSTNSSRVTGAESGEAVCPVGEICEACGYCSSTETCGPLRALKLNTCPGHRDNDVCSTWDAFPSICGHVAYNPFLTKFIPKEQCINGSCTLCFFCRKQNRCVSEALLPTQCTGWEGFCDSVMETCDNVSGVYNTYSRLVHRCVEEDIATSSSCCDVRCSYCAAKGLCLTVKINSDGGASTPPPFLLSSAMCFPANSTTTAGVITTSQPPNTTDTVTPAGWTTAPTSSTTPPASTTAQQQTTTTVASTTTTTATTNAPNITTTTPGPPTSIVCGNFTTSSPQAEEFFATPPRAVVGNNASTAVRSFSPEMEMRSVQQSSGAITVEFDFPPSVANISKNMSASHGKISLVRAVLVAPPTLPAFLRVVAYIEVPPLDQLPGVRSDLVLVVHLIPIYAPACTVVISNSSPFLASATHIQVEFAIVLRASRTSSVSESVQQAAGQVVVYGGVGSAFMGSPTNGLQQARMASYKTLTECEFSDREPLDFSSNPTTLRFGPEMGQFYRGSVIGGFIICGGVFLIICIASLVMGLKETKEKKESLGAAFTMAMAKFHFPSALIIPFSVVIQGVATSSTSLIRLQHVPAVDFAIGCSGLILSFLFVTFVLVITTRWFRCVVGEKEDETLSALERRVPIIHRLMCAVDWQKEWLEIRQPSSSASLSALPGQKKRSYDCEEAAAPKKEEQTGRKVVGEEEAAAAMPQFKNRFQMFFGEYLVPWYLVVELSATLSTGIVMGIRKNDIQLCQRQMVVLLLISTMLLVVSCVLRPCTTVIAMVFMIMCNACAVACSLASVLNVFTRSTTYTFVVDYVSTIANFVLGLKTLLDACVAIVKLLRWMEKLNNSGNPEVTTAPAAAAAPPPATQRTSPILVAPPAMLSDDFDENPAGMPSLQGLTDIMQIDSFLQKAAEMEKAAAEERQAAAKAKAETEESMKRSNASFSSSSSLSPKMTPGAALSNLSLLGTPKGSFARPMVIDEDPFERLESAAAAVLPVPSRQEEKEHRRDVFASDDSDSDDFEL